MKRAIVVILLVALAVFAYPAQWQEAYSAGKAAADEEDYATARKHFERALRLAEEFGERDLRLADTLTKLGYAYFQEDLFDQAREAYLRSLAIRREVKGNDDLTVAASVMNLGYLASYRELRVEAIAYFEEATTIREEQLDPADNEVIESYSRLAWEHRYAGNNEIAERLFRHVVAAKQDDVGEDSIEIAPLWDDLARFYQSVKKTEEEEEAWGRGLAIRERVLGETDELVGPLGDLAGVFYDTGRYAKALTLYERLADIEEAGHGAGSVEFSDALLDIAYCKWSLQEHAEAETLLLRVVEIRTALGPLEGHTASVWAQVGSLRVETERYGEAVEAFEASREVREAAGGTAEQFGELDRNLAEYALRAKDAEKAEAYYKLFSSAQDIGEEGAAEALGNLAETMGSLYYEQEDYAAASKKLEEAIGAYEEAWGTEDERLKGTLESLAASYEKEGRTEESNNAFWRAASIAWKDVLEKTGVPLKTLVFIWVALLAIVIPIAVLAVVLLNRLAVRQLDEKIAWAERTAPPPPRLVRWPGAPLTSVPPPPPPSQSPPRLGAWRLRFHGDGSTLFGIRVVNLLLTLLTLGIYYFWGKVKVRRYIYSQTEFEGDRFAFHGTPIELLLGWLKVVPFLALLFFLPQLLFLVWQSPAAIVTGQFALVMLVILLVPVGQIAAYRYRLARTSWRGIRFSFRGSIFGFLWLNIRSYILIYLTSLLYMPFFEVRVRQYLFGQTWFGDARFDFRGKGLDLLGAWVVMIPLTILSGGVYWFWWSARKARYFWSLTSLGRARFRCTATGGGLFKLWLGNTALLVFTLGLGMAWVTVRNARFWMRHIEIHGDLQLTEVRQEELPASATGEGFADFFGLELGF